MSSFLNPEKVSLEELKQRIITTDLIPSRKPILENIDENFKAISNQGINSWLAVLKVLKIPKKLDELTRSTGIDSQYLLLLKREVESYLPKPFALSEVDWISQDVIVELAALGIKNSTALLEAINSAGGAEFLAKKAGIGLEQMQYLARLADLGRVQWVSATTARMLVEAGFIDSSQLAAANAEDLYEKMDRVNEGGKYFHGKIGLRDIQRLIQAANYVL